MKNIIIFLLTILVILFAIGIVLGLGGLVAWGIGNAIIYLFGINYAWTFWHGFISVFILWGIKFLLNNFLFKD